MITIKIISILMVLIGATFLFLSFAPSRKILKKVSGPLRRKWIIILCLMGFFLLGYIFFDIVLISDLPFPVELVTAGVFLGGAVFVNLIINISQSTIAERQKAEEEIKVLNESLEKRVADRTKALKLSNDFNSTVMNSIADPIAIIDVRTYEIIEVNQAFLRETSLPREQVLGKTCFALTHHRMDPCIPPHDTCPLQETLSHGDHAASGHVHWTPEGEKRFVDVLTSPVWDERGEISRVVHIQRDITERKRSEEALKLSEEKYALSFKHIVDTIYTIDSNFMVTSISPNVEKMLGYSVDELINRPVTDLNIITPESLQKASADIIRVLSGDTIPASIYEFIAKDGTRKFGEVSGSPLYRDGKIIGLISVARDITERMRLEEERIILEERLKRAEKMEVLGTLAGGVAHDLNNVLGVVVGYSELLALELPQDDPVKDYADTILKSSTKGAAIIQDLLTLTRRGVVVSDVVNLNSIVTNFLKTPLFDNLKDYHPQVTFGTDLDRDLLNIKGSPVHLEKTVMNLISNAAEAITGRGEVTIRTENRYLEKKIHGYDWVEKGEYAVLTISDNGGGIPASDIEKIFEPFFTKKVMGRSGTGLGLAVVWWTVKDHHGYIDVQSEPGKGSTFSLYFPISSENPAEDPREITAEEYLGHGESILVVDDIADQRNMAANMLTSLGYNVEKVSSGEEAIEHIRKNKVDLLILDMIMEPGMDGLQTYREIIKINPDQRAVIVSGFSQTDSVNKAMQLGAGAYLKKPYIRKQMGMTVLNVLDR
jgi:two-component system cell cycle sensor histidine kinase/response regulator CckA